jgi:hypothetical protein
MSESVDGTILAAARDQRGTPLAEHAAQTPVLLIFLRHYG